VRPAAAADLPEVFRLAALMYDAMGWDAAGREWREAGTAQLQERLGRDVMVMVAEDPERPDRLAATAAASIATRLPGPRDPTARVAYIQWVSTDPAWRRRGLARAVTAALLRWLADERVLSVELHATAEAEPIYLALGFAQGPHPSMRLRLTPSQAGAP